MDLKQLVSIVKEILSILTMFGDAFIVIFLISLLLNLKYPKIFVAILNFFKKSALSLALFVALLATSGSLFFSEIAKYEPCKLCWEQRIFMYPQVILLFIALWKKDYAVSKYIIPLSAIGAFIAAYHYRIFFTTKIAASGVCTASGGASCVARYVFEFGYVNIPMMSLTAFVLIIIMAFFWSKNKNRNENRV